MAARSGASRLERQAKALPTISGGTPFLLQIPDEDDDILEFLSEKLGIEVVAEYDDGYLIVTSEDLNLALVTEAARAFADAAHGTGSMARILDVEDNPLSEARLRRILRGRLVLRVALR